MRVLIFWFIAVAVSPSFAQPKLVLLKRDNIITRFEEGESIRFKRKSDDTFTRSIIQGIHQGFIVVAEDTINFYDIEKIDVRRKPLTTFKLSRSGKTLIVAGAGLFFIDWFNQKVVQNIDYELGSSTVRGGLLLMGAGGLLQVFNNDYFKIRGRRKLGVIDR